MSKLSSKGKAWETIRLSVLNRDGWRCAVCGKPLEGQDATVDHIVPKAAGGRDELSNLISMCRKCNGIKSDALVLRQTWVNKRWLEYV